MFIKNCNYFGRNKILKTYVANSDMSWTIQRRRQLDTMWKMLMFVNLMKEIEMLQRRQLKLTNPVNLIPLTVVLRRHLNKLLKAFMHLLQRKVFNVKIVILALNVWTVLCCTRLECMKLQEWNSLNLASVQATE